jgi:hypothetical protein
MRGTMLSKTVLVLLRKILLSSHRGHNGKVNRLPALARDLSKPFQIIIVIILSVIIPINLQDSNHSTLLVFPVDDQQGGTLNHRSQYLHLRVKIYKL